MKDGKHKTSLPLELLEDASDADGNLYDLGAMLDAVDIENNETETENENVDVKDDVEDASVTVSNAASATNSNTNTSNSSKYKPTERVPTLDADLGMLYPQKENDIKLLEGQHATGEAFEIKREDFHSHGSISSGSEDENHWGAESGIQRSM